MFKFEKTTHPPLCYFLIFEYHCSPWTFFQHFKHAEVPQVIQRTNTENNCTAMLLKRLRN